MCCMVILQGLARRTIGETPLGLKYEMKETGHGT